MASIRICLYTEVWASGGIEAFITNMLCSQPLEGIEADIVASRIDESIYTEQLRTLGVGFYQLSGRLRTPKNKSLFRALLRERQYDIVHLNIFHGLALEFLEVARREGVAVRIAHCHGAGLRKSPTRWLKLMLHALGRRLWLGAATDRLACSAPASRFMFGDESARVVPNGIKLSRFGFDERLRREWRERLGFGSEVVVGHVGRLSAEKNHAFLLEVFSEYQRLNPDSILLMVGEGEEREQIEWRAKELGIFESMRLIGRSGNVPELMMAMDAFVFPSTSEGLGIAAIEAQATGLPILISDGVPSAVLLTDSSASLPLGDSAEWAARLDALIKAGTDRTGGAEIVRRSGYDAQEAASVLFDFYRARATDKA